MSPVAPKLTTVVEGVDGVKRKKKNHRGLNHKKNAKKNKKARKLLLGASVLSARVNEGTRQSPRLQDTLKPPLSPKLVALPTAKTTTNLLGAHELTKKKRHRGSNHNKNAKANKRARKLLLLNGGNGQLPTTAAAGNVVHELAVTRNDEEVKPALKQLSASNLSVDSENGNVVIQVNRQRPDDKETNNNEIINYKLLYEAERLEKERLARRIADLEKNKMPQKVTDARKPEDRAQIVLSSTKRNTFSDEQLQLQLAWPKVEVKTET